MLLRSGMTARRALAYNMVSSVLAYSGMCAGVLLTGVHWTASSWVFALTAGIFIYVSLVDMVCHKPVVNQWRSSGMGRTGKLHGPRVQGPPSFRPKNIFPLQWVKLLTDLQILSCELHKNAFGGRTPPAPAGGEL